MQIFPVRHNGHWLFGLHSRDRDVQAKNVLDPGQEIPCFMWNGGQGTGGNTKEFPVFLLGL